MMTHTDHPSIPETKAGRLRIKLDYISRKHINKVKPNLKRVGV